ncbi:MAG: ABC transporter permease subunit [Clostridia bacterium]
MSNIFKILKKELDKIFKSKRMIFSTFIMPALVIFLVYSAIGAMENNSMTDKQNHVSQITYIGQQPADLKPFIDAVEVVKFTQSEKQLSKDEIKALIKSGSTDLVVEFIESSNGKIILNSYGDSFEKNSPVAINRLNAILEIYQKTAWNTEFGDIEKYNNTFTELADGNRMFTSLISIVLPMMLVITLFANAMGFSAETIAGEKERGTLATLMMAPIKRTDIIFAKVFSNSIITLLVALSTFIGMAFSLNSLSSILGGAGHLSYGFTEYALLLLLILTVALTSVSLFSIASAVAKTVKEANSLSMPIYLLGMLAAIVPSYIDTPSAWYFYLIPIYNCTISLKTVLSFDISPLNLIITFLSSFVFFISVCLFLSKLFKKESILFGH